MRIAILCDRIPPESTGGAATIAWSLARGLLGAGHEVHVIATTTGQPFEQVREGVATYHLHADIRAGLWSYYSVFNPGAVRALRSLLARIRPDIVNAHNVQNGLSFTSLAAAHRLGIPVVWNSHDVSAISLRRLTHFVDPLNLDPRPPVDYRMPVFHDFRRAGWHWNPMRIPLTRALIRANTRLRVAVSQAHADALTANGLPPFRVVHNGIDTARFEKTQPAAANALRDRLGLAGRRVILFAGRLRRDKGSAQVIKAMDALAERVPDATLLVLADKAYAARGRLWQEFPRVIEHHLAESGWLSGDDLVGAYGLAEVAVVPSICLDSFPTVNLEAMAAGKPVVATCFGGSPEAVIDGETGYIVNPFDARLFAERLESLLMDEGLRRRMGEAGRRRARERFSLERYVGDMLAIYDEAAG